MNISITHLFISIQFQEDDSDLIMSSRRDVTTNQRARTQGISTKQIIDKSTLSKIMKSRPRMDIKCNSEELRKVMLEVLLQTILSVQFTINLIPFLPKRQSEMK